MNQIEHSPVPHAAGTENKNFHVFDFWGFRRSWQVGNRSRSMYSRAAGTTLPFIQFFRFFAGDGFCGKFPNLLFPDPKRVSELQCRLWMRSVSLEADHLRTHSYWIGRVFVN